MLPPQNDSIPLDEVRRIIRNRRNASLAGMLIVAGLFVLYLFAIPHVSIMMLSVMAGVVFIPLALLFALNYAHYPEPRDSYRFWNKLVYIYFAKIFILLSILQSVRSGSAFISPQSMGRRIEDAVDATVSAGVAYGWYKSLKPAALVEAYFAGLASGSGEEQGSLAGEVEILRQRGMGRGQIIAELSPMWGLPEVSRAVAEQPWASSVPASPIAAPQQAVFLDTPVSTESSVVRWVKVAGLGAISGIFTFLAPFIVSSMAFSLISGAGAIGFYGALLLGLVELPLILAIGALPIYYGSRLFKVDGAIDPLVACAVSAAGYFISYSCLSFIDIGTFSFLEAMFLLASIMIFINTLLLLLFMASGQKLWLIIPVTALIVYGTYPVYERSKERLNSSGVSQIQHHRQPA